MELETIIRTLTLITGFYMAWNIGANDVANAMGTSVGSRALTLKKAVILAAILEFSGAFFVGSHVSETIQKEIVQPEIFMNDPHLFVLGMMGALLATGIWLQSASYLGLPVSTTHAIVGAVVGFGVIIGGAHAVDWVELFRIASSWVLSPFLSGVISFLIFSLLQKKIFFALNPLKATKRIAPFMVFFCFLVFSMSLLFEGLANLNMDLPFQKALFISIPIALLAGSIGFILIRKVKITQFQASEHVHPEHVLSLEKAIKHLRRVKLSSKKETQDKVSAILSDVKNLNEDLRKQTRFEERTSEFHDVERIFVYLQIISACLVAFGHGANDVANAIGPVAAVFDVLKNQSISMVSEVPVWLLALGGTGIVVGLATWGWRVIETVGKKITELTPTRGFSAEFGAATTILIASKMGLPISTTHSLVGGVLGVGLARGLSALNLRTLRDIFLSWVITIPISAILSIVLFYILKAIFA
ncbi:MAG: inorganic phosphate transporter [Chlamydiae bacterium CG10_big_fil_rev_8_21_14_0_10_35_9]|nr:MAG: inorganic phosphate transporter [Chlamydiae bacterium CG10_big_fil_rev_8_21_14_0_10_35_9]